MENPKDWVLERDVVSGKPYRAMRAFGTWYVANRYGVIVCKSARAYDEKIAEGIAHGIAIALNQCKNIELPAL